MRHEMTALICAIALLATGPAKAEQIAIVGATVLPMTGEERLTDQTVIVDGDRIVTIGPRKQVQVPAGARSIDGSGKVLMPGLVDMHIHLSPVSGEPGDSAQRAMAVMLSHGVTTARSMIGAPSNLVVREKVESGMLAGPRLYLAAPFLTDGRVPTVEAARAAVATAAADGYDFVKFVNVSAPTTAAAVHEAARAAKIGVGGHVSNAIGTSAAAAAGQQIEHLDAMFFALLPAGARPSEPFGQFPPRAVLHALSNLPDGELDAYAKSLPRTWHVPTLSLFEKLMDVSLPSQSLRSAPEMRFVPPFVLDQWAEQRAQFQQVGYSPEDARLFADLRRRLTRALHRAGAPVMAGSDTAQSFHVWGAALHSEIASLAAAGLSPMEALRAATVIPRDFFRSLPNGGSSLGWKADFGTVEAGARADLILLREDPSRSLAALKTLDTVIAGGRLYNRSTLDALLARAEADARLQPPPPQ